jgi:hypothetical protein
VINARGLPDADVKKHRHRQIGRDCSVAQDDASHGGVWAGQAGGARQRRLDRARASQGLPVSRIGRCWKDELDRQRTALPQRDGGIGEGRHCDRNGECPKRDGHRRSSV